MASNRGARHGARGAGLTGFSAEESPGRSKAEAVGRQAVIVLHERARAVVAGRTGERRPDLELIIAPERELAGEAVFNGASWRICEVAAFEAASCGVIGSSGETPAEQQLEPEVQASIAVDAIARADKIVGLDLVPRTIPVEPASLSFDSPFWLHIQVDECRRTHQLTLAAEWDLAAATVVGVEAGDFGARPEACGTADRGLG